MPVARALAVLGLLPTAAPAACLTAADLDPGIRATFANGDWVEVWRGIEGLLRVDIYFADLRTGASLLEALGVYRIAESQWDGGYPVTRTLWPMERSEFPVPEADGPDWSARTTIDLAYEDETGEVWTAGRTFEFGPAAPLSVSGCTYEGVMVHETYVPDAEWDRAPYELDTFFIPALGAGIRLPYGDPATNPHAAAIVAIEPIPPSP